MRLILQKYLAVLFLLFIFIYFLSDIQAEILHTKSKWENRGYPESRAEYAADYYDTFVSIFDNMLDENSSFPVKMKLVEYHGMLQRAMYKSINGDVLKADNNNWLYLEVYRIMKPEVKTEHINNLNRFSDYVSSKGIPFLFVIYPCKNIIGYTHLPYGIKEYSNESAAMFASELEKRSVNVLNLNPLVAKHIPEKAMFYKTDHHWRVETAFYGTGLIIDKLNDLYGFNIDPSGYNRNINNYNLTKIGGPFLGSSGKRVGASYVGTDDFYFPVPKFNNKLRISCPKKKTLESELIKVIFRDNYVYGNDIYLSKHDEMFKYGDKVLIENLNNPNGLRVLMLRDSFGLSVAAFMSLSVSEMLIYDPRCDKHVPKDLVDEFKPDLVLVAYNPSFLLDPEFFDFDKIVKNKDDD